MFKFIKKLFGRKPDNTPVIDKMIEKFGRPVVNNDVTYSGGLYGKTANEEDLPPEVKSKKYFKIKIGQLMSGYGDWGGGFERTYKPYVEIHIDGFSKVLHVCAGKPFYNSSGATQRESVIAEKLVDEFNEQLAQSEDKCIMTNNRWLRGVLDTIRSVCWTGGVDLWQHRIEIQERN